MQCERFSSLVTLLTPLDMLQNENSRLGDVLAETNHCNMSDGCYKFDYAAHSW
jgi:hypothetical protein